MVASKLDCIHFHVVEIVLENYITPMAARKLGYIHLYVLQIKLGNYINTSWATRVLIRPRICINTPWQQESWVACICIWCQSDLKIVSAPHGNKKIGLHPFICGANQILKIT
jgi:hypothetical protein